MKIFRDGYQRLDEKDIQILQFVHEQYLGAWLHFKMLCEAEKPGQGRIHKLLKNGYLERRHWKEQNIHYFTLARKGLKSLQNRHRRPDQLMPLYQVSESLNRRIGEHLKAGLLRMIFWKLGLKDWTSERVLRERDQKTYPVPTGNLSIVSKKIAMHFEESLKRSVKGCEKLFEDYTRAGYDEVWMIVGWDIPDFFRKAQDQFRSLWPQVWFVSYETFIRKGDESIFCNHEGASFLLRDFITEVKGAPAK